MKINNLVEMVHGLAVEKGWHDSERSMPDYANLFRSEIAEAFEAYRDNKPAVYEEDGKPEGYAIELIDCVIRILDYLGESSQNCPSEIAELSLNELVGRESYNDFSSFIDKLYLNISDFSIMNASGHKPYRNGHLVKLLKSICTALRRKELDPEALLLIKHEYNKTRPYRHGGKKV